MSDAYIRGGFPRWLALFRRRDDMIIMTIPALYGGVTCIYIHPRCSKYEAPARGGPEEAQHGS